MRTSNPWRLICQQILLVTLLPLVATTAGCQPQDGPRNIRCNRDSDCGNEICRLLNSSQFTPLPDAPLEPTPPDDVRIAELGCGLPQEALEPPGADCENETSCQHAHCSISGACLRPCLDGDDCSHSESCVPVYVRLENQAVSSWACVSALPRRAKDTLEITTAQVSLGVGAQTISLPGSAEPTLYVLDHPSDDNWPFSSRCRPPLCPTQLSTSSGAILFERGSSSPHHGSPISDSPYTFPMTVYIGNGIAPSYDGAGYKLVLEAEQSGTANLTMLTRNASRGSWLDLNIYYAETELRDDPEGTLATAIAELARILSQADIFLGEVRHLDIPKNLSRRGTTFEHSSNPRNGFSPLLKAYGVWPELPALLRLSAGSNNTGINLFLVSDIEGMGGGDIQALAGGTPGPLGMQGTGASGVAIAADMMVGQAGQLGRTMAHEIGHYLGLFHVHESDGTSLDPLGDTPRCLNAPDFENCNTAAMSNLMHWAKGEGTELTAEQRTILRRAPILY